ncbi:hypothetical protein [Paenibacillus sp. YN15]|uniref:hypothetical protein n=1 Tax=Paenibacillus sp. YN15 TaxID=1742774 RepID=UPI000DCE0E27|nr:hypothetical protein [Paenibacillus sp. YN15]RAU96843.1 hypothetical protein DQG13_20020 [Paenibacillus sp. YN15]
MASGMGATDVGAIRATLTLNVGNFKQGMDNAKKQMREVDASAKTTTRSLEGIAGALVSLGASKALVGLARTVKSLTDEAQAASMAVKGLAEVSKALNVNIEQSTGLAQELANKGFMTLAEASSAVKTLLSSGLGLEETRKLIYATADAAAYNREAHLSWGEAIVQVTRGIKSGNSELTDAAGITTNLSVMYDRYAKSIGTTADKLTDAQKVQAAYSEIMKESTLYAGNADTALQGYAGTQAVFNQTITVARQELGEAYLPAIQKLMETLTPIIADVTTWISANKEMTVGLTAAAAAFLAVAAAVGTLSAALSVLQVSLGPVGWAIAGITAVAGAVTAYVVASDAASESTLKWAKNQDVLNAKLAQDATKRSAEDIRGLRGDIDTLNGILEKRNKLMDEYNALERKAQSGQGSIENTHRALDLADGIKEVDASLRKMDFKNADEASKALQRMNQAYEDSIPARVQVEKSTITELAQRVQQTNGTEALRKKYEELSRVEKLNDAQKAELASTVKQLAQQYPDVIAQMDEEGRYIITNTDLLDAQIRTEREIVRTKAELRKQDLQDLQKTTKAKIQAATAEITALKAVLEATTTKKSVIDAPTFDESKVNPLLTGKAREYAIAEGKRLNDEAQRQIKAETEKSNELQASLIELSRMIKDIDSNTWDDYLPKTGGGGGGTGTEGGPKKTGKTAAEIAAELRRDLFAQDLATMRYNAAMYDQSADDQIAAIEEIRQKHAQYLAENIEDERSLALQVKALNATKTEDAAKAAKAAYEYSAEWIEMEERRLREKGSSEAEVAQMQLDAWTRVKARYDSDSDEYRAADKALYTARMTLIKEAEAVARKADESREQSAKEAKDAALDAIDEQKRAELKALDERKQAVKDYYDAQLKALDQSERVRDRSKIEAEAEKYRLATSEAGQKHYAELLEELRKMDVEDQKTALQDARDSELDALDKRKDDIESWYSDIKASIENFGGDISQIYAATEDSRFQAFVTTNARIKAEMERFKSEMSTLNNVSSSSGSGQSSYEASILRQMKANANAWWTADDAGKRRLEAESQALGASIGATNYGGTWYRGGVPLFHSGGIAGVSSFRSGSGLASDELRAILRQGEVTLTPAQIQSVVSGIGGKGSGGTTVHIEKVIEMNGATFEDSADWSGFERNAGDETAAILRKMAAGQEVGV